MVIVANTLVARVFTPIVRVSVTLTVLNVETFCENKSRHILGKSFIVARSLIGIALALKSR